MTPSRRAAESATSPLLTKAAEEAAADYFAGECPSSRSLAKVIVSHLAPVQKEMKEAREIILFSPFNECSCSCKGSPEKCIACRAKDWLARNPEGVGV